MDKFLHSNFGEKGLGTNEAATFAQNLRREVAAEQQSNLNNNSKTADSLYEPNSIDEKDITNETTMM